MAPQRAHHPDEVARSNGELTVRQRIQHDDDYDDDNDNDDDDDDNYDDDDDNYDDNDNDDIYDGDDKCLLSLNLSPYHPFSHHPYHNNSISELSWIMSGI